MKKKRWFRNTVSIVVVALMMVTFSVPSYAGNQPDGAGEPGGSAIDEGGDAWIDIEPGDDPEEGDEGGLPPGDDALGEDEDAGLAGDGDPLGEFPDEALPDEGEGLAEEGLAEGTEEAEQVEPADEEELPGVPDGYELTGRQKEMKRELKSLGVIKALGEMRPGIDYVPGEFLFPAEGRQDAEIIAEAYDGELIEVIGDIGVGKIDEDSEFSLESLVALGADESNNMPPIEPNIICHLLDVPDDPYLDPATAGANYQWHHDAIYARDAWAVTTGDARIRVMVLDTAVSNHDDLDIEDFAGDAGDHNRNVHGTHVAGIIGAKANSARGVGVAPDVSLYSFNADDGDGMPASLTIEGLEKAAEWDVHIVNISAGTPFPNASLKKKVLSAMDNGIAIVAAAGNICDFDEAGYMLGSKALVYPAAYSKDVIVVGNSNRQNVMDQTSVTNSFVDLCAPGTDIVSTTSRNPMYPYNTGSNFYTSLTGTSMAAPVVSGVAALVLSVYSNPDEPGDLTGDGKRTIADVRRLESILKSSVNKGGSSGMGAGVIDASKAVGAGTVAALTPKATWTVNGTASTGKTVVLNADSIELEKLHSADRVFYTFNGKAPTAKSAEYIAGVSDPIKFPKAGKLTFKALSIGSNGKASKVLTIKFTVKVKVERFIDPLWEDADRTSAYGTAYQFKVKPYPANASNKKMVWSFPESEAAAAAAQGFKWKDKNKGILTVPAKTEANKATIWDKITVVATPADKYGGVTPFELNLTDGVILDGHSRYLTAGKSVTLKPVYFPANASAAAKKVSWELLDDGEALAEYGEFGEEGYLDAGDLVPAADYLKINTANGKITAKTVRNGPPAKMTVKATQLNPAEGRPAGVAEFEITVYPAAVTSVALPKTYTLFYDLDPSTRDTWTECAESVDLSAHPKYKVKAGAGAYEKINWTSSNEGVAKVDANGFVIPVGAGKAKITAAAMDGSGKKAACTVTVKNMVTSLDLDTPAMGNRIIGKKSMQLTAAFNPGATDKGLTWTSSDGKLAKVSSKGKVTTQKKVTADTEVTITAKSKSNKEIACEQKIIVVPATKVSWAGAVPKATETIYTSAITGLQADCTFVAETDAGSATGIVYTSSNAAIAGVDAGKVSALKPGTVTIKAAAADYSGVNKSYKVTVFAPTSGIAVGPKEPSVRYWRYYDEDFDDISWMPNISFTDGTYKRIAIGKSAAFVATPYSAYGKGTNPKVNWELVESSYWYYDWLWDIYGQHASVDSKGKVSVSKNMPKNEEMEFRVKATVDGEPWNSQFYDVQVVLPDTDMKVGYYYLGYRGSGLYLLELGYKGEEHADFKVTINNDNAMLLDFYYAGYDYRTKKHYCQAIVASKKKNATFNITFKSYSTGTSKSSGNCWLDSVF